jgi:hypothetical protein
MCRWEYVGVKWEFPGVFWEYLGVYSEYAMRENPVSPVFATHLGSILSRRPFGFPALGSAGGRQVMAVVSFTKVSPVLIFAERRKQVLSVSNRSLGSWVSFVRLTAK